MLKENIMAAIAVLHKKEILERIARGNKISDIGKKL